MDRRQEALDLHRSRRDRLERGTHALHAMEQRMRAQIKDSVKEKMESTFDAEKIEGHEEDGSYVLAVLETAPDEYRLRDEEPPAPDDDALLIRIYTKCLATLVAGRLHSVPEEGVPAPLTENNCLLLKNALLSEELQVGLSDADMLEAGAARSSACLAEFKRQLALVEKHPFYSADAFQSSFDGKQTEKVGKGVESGLDRSVSSEATRLSEEATPFEVWKVAEQKRLSAVVEEYEAREMFSGRFSVRCSAASGLHKGQHVCCCVRIGLLSQQTKVVTVDGDGIATWDEALVFDLDADPSLMATIQHVEDDAEKAFPDCVVVELLRTHHHSHEASTVVGSTRVDGTRKLWCPKPHFRTLPVEIQCGWKTSHGHTKHSERDTISFVKLDVQYYFRCNDVRSEPPAESGDAHEEFRILTRKLSEHLAADTEDAARARSAFSWMLDNYAEGYGVGRSYRRLYELRTHLGRFKLRADSLVRVTVDLKFLQEEGDGDSRQLWTKAEHGIYDECLMHIETLLTQSFLTINASFDMRFVTPSSRQSEIDCALSSAVNLFKTVVLAVHGDEAYDELLFDLLIAGADKVIDAILGHDHVTCHALNTLLHVAEHSLNEYDTTFRTGLTAFATPDIPGRVMRHFAARVEAALADLSENEIVLHWEHALDAYHSALEFADTAAHLSLVSAGEPGQQQLSDLRTQFAPAFEQFVVNNEERLCKWADECCGQDSFAPICASPSWGGDDEGDELSKGLHSTGVNDLVRFLLRTAGEFKEFTDSPTREAEVVSTVVIHYAERLQEGCEKAAEALNGPPSRPRSALKRARSKTGELMRSARHHGSFRGSPGGPPAEHAEPEPEDAAAADWGSKDIEEYFVRINNAFVLAHHRVSEFAMEPHRIIPSLSPDADESEDADAVSDIFTRTQGQLRKIWRGLADSIVEAELAQLEQLVEKLSAEESDRIWEQLHDSVDSLLNAAYESLYPKLFQRLLKQLCLGVFTLLERGLNGSLRLPEAPASGRDLADLFSGIIERLCTLFAPDCEGALADRVGLLSSSLNHWIKCHASPTEALIARYHSLAATRSGGTALDGHVQCEYRGKGDWHAVFMELWKDGTLVMKEGGPRGEVLRTVAAVGCTVGELKHARKGHEWAFRVDLPSKDSAGDAKYAIAVESEDEKGGWVGALSKFSSTGDGRRGAEAAPEPEPEPEPEPRQAEMVRTNSPFL